MPFQFFEHFEGIQDHLHVHGSDSNLNVSFHGIESGSKGLMIGLNNSMIFAFFLNKFILVLLKFDFHLFPYSDGSIEVLLFVVHVDENFKG